jgi:hypothetical protein
MSEDQQTPGTPETVDGAGPPEETPDGTPAQCRSPKAALRMLSAAVTLPWLVVYGITGAWAVTLGARGAVQGLERMDAGYTRMVTPLELMYVGALLLAAFAVLLACALLLLSGRRSAMLWLPVLLVAAGLTVGSVWAAVSGGLHPLLWVLFFFGLAYVTVVALFRMAQMTRAGRSATIVAP